MNLPALTFTREQLAQTNLVLEQEWLLTNGLGGYASSTVPAVNTRKYHGLLVAALEPPGVRTVCLSKLDEDIEVGDFTFRLGANEFRDSIYPQGYRYLEALRIDPFPTYTYQTGDVTVKKTVFMPKNKNAVGLLYSIQNKSTQYAKVKLYPLLTCRFFHNVVDRTKTPFSFSVDAEGADFQAIFTHIQATVYCHASEGQFVKAQNWVERLHYHDDSERGESDYDDCFQPGYFSLQVAAGETLDFEVACAANRDALEAKAAAYWVGSTFLEAKTSYRLEQDETQDLLSNFYVSHPSVPRSDWLSWVLIAADSFVVNDKAGGKSIIAGYHWFEPWGRDTFISLPGLLLVTGRHSDARDILATFGRYLKVGLIPNFITDKTGDAAYNTVDGTLWYINAVLQYVKYTGDYGFVRDKLWENLQSIITNHQQGTMFGIHLDTDGMLIHGAQLTWMDAEVGNNAITPRSGKAVEIQALWYNALKSMEMFATKFEDTTLAALYGQLASQVKEAFNSKFWNHKHHCLYDTLSLNGSSDSSMRPNQILAVSLDYGMLDADRSKGIVEAVKLELVTPFGLRTLSLGDPKFVGKCFGDRRRRDAAYHNGTIWPWLLGPYITAYLKVNGYNQAACREALDQLIEPLFSRSIRRGGLGAVSEIYDSDPPNEPRGCISQAWSVAEPLRAYVEDVLQVKPLFG